MITTKLVIPDLTEEEEREELDKEAREFEKEIQEGGMTPRSEKEDHDAPSTTAAGSEPRGGECFQSCLLPDAAHSAPDGDEKPRGPGLSRSLLSQHDVLHSRPAPIEWIVVRIEVTDTGCGIRPKDMVQTKLFCTFALWSVYLECSRSRSCLQPDGDGSATGRQRHRPRSRPCPSDREAQWWSSGCPVQGQRRVDFLG